MTWQEIRQNIDAVFEMIKEEMANRYMLNPDAKPGDFLNDQKVAFTVCKMGNTPPWDCLVISYEDTGEDGKLFYPSDYKSFEELLQAMVEEIGS